MPRLRILVSTPNQAYPPKQPLGVNSPSPTEIKTPGFEGEMSVWIKDFQGDDKKGEGDEYFGREGRGGMTYAIVIRGRFLTKINADDLVFGNVFEKPIKDRLPWGTSIALKAVHYVDPNVELDIYADKPWAVSPTLATFNYLSLSSQKPEYAPIVAEDSLERLAEMYEGDSLPPGMDEVSGPAEHKAARKRWLGNAEHRRAVTVDKDTWVGMEFCNGYLDFNTLSVKLPPPFTMTFPLLQYWDGQPVTYVCKRRAREGEDQTQGEVFFAVAFEIVDEEAKRMLAEKEKAGGEAAINGEEKGEGEGDESDGDSEDEEDGDDEEFEDAQPGSNSDVD